MTITFDRGLVGPIVRSALISLMSFLRRRYINEHFTITFVHSVQSCLLMKPDFKILGRMSRHIYGSGVGLSLAVLRTTGSRHLKFQYFSSREIRINWDFVTVNIAAKQSKRAECCTVANVKFARV